MFTSTDAVRRYTSIKPKDLGFETDADLDAWLEDRILEIDDLIINYVGVAWTDATVPLGVQRIALDMARNFTATMMVSRETPTVQVSDFKVRITEPDVFTKSVKDALDAYKPGATPAGVVAVRMFRVRREDEMPDV